MDLRPALLALLLLASQPAAHAASPLRAAPAPMLASRITDDIDIAAWLVSEKLDGVRARWDGRQLVTRAGNRIDAPAWFTAGWPAQAIDGELWIGRGRFQDISDLVRALRGDAAGWRQVRFMAFDLPASPHAFASRTRELRVLVEETASPRLQRI
ncbi:MAG TPA: DNA ligase, partial [Thermomonas sp.]|nr:DNA ligase [Thermomonas sp.]